MKQYKKNESFIPKYTKTEVVAPTVSPSCL